MTPIQKIVNHFGSQAAAARLLGVTPMAISQWKKRGVPISAAIDVEKASGGVINRAELRPDVFGFKAA